MVRGGAAVGDVGDETNTARLSGAFGDPDVDGDGALSLEEFTLLAKVFGATEDEHVKQLFDHLTPIVMASYPRAGEGAHALLPQVLQPPGFVARPNRALPAAESPGRPPLRSGAAVWAPPRSGAAAWAWRPAENEASSAAPRLFAPPPRRSTFLSVADGVCRCRC